MSETTNAPETNAPETNAPETNAPETLTARKARKIKEEEGIDLSSPLARKILAAAREQARKEFEAKEAKRIAEEKLSRVRPMIETAREIMAGIEREAKGGDVDRILRAIRRLSSPAQGAYLLLRQTPGYSAKRGRPANV